jgi:voltage-gated potassium channel
VRYFCALERAGDFIESGLGTQYHLTFDEWHILSGWSCLSPLFLPSNISCVLSAGRNPFSYIFSFWGVIDLATILPLYVMWLWPEIS